MLGVARPPIISARTGIACAAMNAGSISRIGARNTPAAHASRWTRRAERGLATCQWNMKCLGLKYRSHDLLLCRHTVSANAGIVQSRHASTRTGGDPGHSDHTTKTTQHDIGAESGSQDAGAEDGDDDEDELEDADDPGATDASERAALLSDVLGMQEPVVSFAHLGRTVLEKQGEYTPVAPGSVWVELPSIGVSLPVPTRWLARTEPGSQQLRHFLTGTGRILGAACASAVVSLLPVTRAAPGQGVADTPAIAFMFSRYELRDSEGRPTGLLAAAEGGLDAPSPASVPDGVAASLAGVLLRLRLLREQDSDDGAVGQPGIDAAGVDEGTRQRALAAARDAGIPVDGMSEAERARLYQLFGQEAAFEAALRAPEDTPHDSRAASTAIADAPAQALRVLGTFRLGEAEAGGAPAAARVLGIDYEHGSVRAHSIFCVLPQATALMEATFRCDTSVAAGVWAAVWRGGAQPGRSRGDRATTRARAIAEALHVRSLPCSDIMDYLTIHT